MSRNFWVIFTSFIFGAIFFLPQSSYAGSAGFVSDGFDFPLGRPNGDGYGVECCYGLPFLGRYDYEGDGLKEYHPGEDWNDDSSGRDFGNNNNDAGDPVYAIGNGLTISAKYEKSSWGYVVLIEHQLANGTKYWSQYAHLKNISKELLNKSQINVKRGDVIGWVGDFEHGTGRAYHLHFEIRKKFRRANDFVFDWSQEKVKEYYLDPSEFIKANRPVPPPVAQKLTSAASGKNGAELTWDESTGKDFERYELYRSEVEGGTADVAKREKLFTAADLKTLKFSDVALYAGQSYYYRLYTYYKDGQVAASNEVNIRLERETQNISNAPGVQRYVGISGNKVYWESVPREQDAFPQKRTLHYYDITAEETGSIPIGSVFDNQIEGPYKPQIGGDWLCYSGKRSRYGNYDIYCRNLAAGNMSADIQITTYNGNDNDPQVSAEGIVTWQGGYDDAKRVYWVNLGIAPQINEVSSTVGYQSQPRIWGSNIVWVQQTAVGAQKDLYSKNIETGTEGLVAADIGDGTIDIWEDSVIYNKDGKLLLSDLAGQTSATIEGALNARMRDEKIVYTKQDGTGGKYSIYVYIIASKKTVQAAELLKYQPAPVVYEDMVAYNAAAVDSSLDMDIYLTYL